MSVVVEVCWNDLANLGGNGLSDIALQLAVLPHLLAFESELLLLGKVLSLQGTNFVENVQKYWFRRSRSLSTPLGEVANVSSGHIHGSVCGECDAVRKLSMPTFSVKLRLIPRLLDDVHWHPSLAVCGVNLKPDMVF
jgi:hypothetical protein